MNRREFSKSLLVTLSGIAFFDVLYKKELFPYAAKDIANDWLKDLHIMCMDLRKNSITPFEWQQKINDFHEKLPLEDLINMIDFENSIKNFEYPDLGVVTTDPALPKVEGVSENYSFVGRIFGMQKDRAIIPHGHKNMTSCHRVLKGEFLLKQYDRLNDEGEHMFIKQTIEEIGKEGSFSSISDDKNNIHWLTANTDRAYTFDVIVVGLNEQPTEIDNIDIYEGEKLENDILKVKKIAVGDALKKYGKSHH